MTKRFGQQDFGFEGTPGRRSDGEIRPHLSPARDQFTQLADEAEAWIETPKAPVVTETRARLARPVPVARPQVPRSTSSPSLLPSAPMANIHPGVESERTARRDFLAALKRGDIDGAKAVRVDARDQGVNISFADEIKQAIVYLVGLGNVDSARSVMDAFPFHEKEAFIAFLKKRHGFDFNVAS